MSCVAASCVDAGPAPRPVGGDIRERVRLLHGSAGSAEMWTHTCDEFGSRYRCSAPDLIGYGTSMPWPPDKPFNLDSELHAIKPLLPCCGEKIHVVGYPYGGVLGLFLALSNPALVQTLTLIEPVFFAALRYKGNRRAYDQFRDIRDTFMSRLSGGDTEAAMSGFIDFWTGEGTWASSPPAIREYMQERANKIILDWQASFDAVPDKASLAALGPRTMLIRGDESPQPMCELVDSLHQLMPGSSHKIIPGANHLLPFTHKRALHRALMFHLPVAEQPSRNPFA